MDDITQQSRASKELEIFQMLIGGDWVDATQGRTFESKSPCTGQSWAQFPRAGEEDVDRAVQAAYKAFSQGPWSQMTASERGLLLHRMGDIVAANAEYLAELEVRDNGKLMIEMLGQMRYLPQWFYYYGGLADKVEGVVTPIDKAGMLHYVRHEPVGVVAAITPWNSPLMLTLWKLAPALAAGNTVVVKPSEHASASMIGLARLFEQGGFPPGVVNVVTGFGNEVGTSLVTHPLVSRVAFTGGDIAGRAIATSAAASFKRLSLELGGKSPHIVFDDADLDAAVNGVISGIFAAAGQTCMAGSRVFLQRSIHDEFVEKLVTRVKKARIGDPLSTDTDVGPIATEAQLERVMSYIEIAQSEGAFCVLGGRRFTVDALPGGWFVEPTIFTNVRNDMRIAQEEVFGPVLSVIPFDTEEEVIEMANATLYGLAAGFWTTDLDRAINLPKRLKAGTIWVNAYRVVSYMAPFGGFKHSGLGRENGIGAIYEYLEQKSVFLNGISRIKNPFTLQ
jgi:acyl-CoA reductase-like NAD-dependent aldehyde dehydrogenase